MKTEPFIMLVSSPAVAVTVSEYEKIQKGLKMRAFLGTTQLGDAALSALLLNAEERYNEIMYTPVGEPF